MKWELAGTGLLLTAFPIQMWGSLLSLPVSYVDKKLVVAIEGSVEEAKALYKPPEDSQGELGWCCHRQRRQVEKRVGSGVDAEMAQCLLSVLLAKVPGS